MSTELEQIDNHVELARGLFIEQFRNSENLKSFMDGFVTQVQTIEDMLIDLWQQRFLDVAVGDQLDGLGEIVGQDRDGLDDDDYRIRIKARIRINVSSGLESDIVDVFGILLEDTTPPMRIEEYYPAAIIVYLDEFIEGGADFANVLADILHETRAAAVDTQLVYLPRVASNVFSFSSLPDTTESSSSLGFADDSQTTGGALADVIEA